MDWTNTPGKIPFLKNFPPIAKTQIFIYGDAVWIGRPIFNALIYASGEFGYQNAPDINQNSRKSSCVCYSVCMRDGYVLSVWPREKDVYYRYTIRPRRCNNIRRLVT